MHQDVPRCNGVKTLDRVLAVWTGVVFAKHRQKCAVADSVFRNSNVLTVPSNASEYFGSEKMDLDPAEMCFSGSVGV